MNFAESLGPGKDGEFGITTGELLTVTIGFDSITNHGVFDRICNIVNQLVSVFEKAFKIVTGQVNGSADLREELKHLDVDNGIKENQRNVRGGTER